MEGLSVNDAVSKLRAISSGRSPISGIVKSLGLFMSCHDEELSRIIHEVLELFQPLNDLDKLVRFKLADRYKVFTEIYRMLESGDSYMTVLALKCTWYFAELDDSAGFLSNISSFSLSTRLKLINKYAAHLKNPKAGEEIYKGIRNRYGIRAAVFALPACSENFLRNELFNLKLLLPPSLMLHFFKKYPSLTTDYMKHVAPTVLVKARTQFRNYGFAYRSVFVKLAKVDIIAFTEIVDQHKFSVPYVQLGRRPTKKLIKTTPKAISMYNFDSGLFKPKLFFTCLRLGQVKELYVSSLLPPTVFEFVNIRSGDVFEILEHFKLPVRCDIIQAAFLSKYNKTFLSGEIVNYLTETCVRYVPSECRIKWVGNKLAKMENAAQQSKFIAFLPVELSIPKLKKLVESQTNPAFRIAIAKNMVKTFNINQCSEGISDLFSYFVTRFRNESVQFREGIVKELDNLGKLMLDLKISDWELISNFVDIIKLNEEVDQFKTPLQNIFCYQIYCYFLKKADTETILKNYLEFIRVHEDEDFGFGLFDDDPCYSRTFKVSQNPNCQKYCYEWFLKKVPDMKKDSSTCEFVILLLRDVSNFNSKNAGNRLELPGWLIEFIEENINNLPNLPTDSLVVHDILECLAENNDVQLHRRMLFKCFPSYIRGNFVFYLLKEHPDVVLCNISKVVQVLFTDLKKYKLLCRKSRLYCSYGLPSTIIKICQNRLNDTGSSTTAKVQALQALSVLLEQDEYLELVSTYLPDKFKLIQYSEEMKTTLDIQKAICNNFSNLPVPSGALPLMRKFAVGDYLKFVTSSLVRSFVRAPENKILLLFKEWDECPMALQKHFVRLTCKIAPLDYKIDTLVSMFNSETHTSLRLVIYLQLYNAFVVDPNDNTYGLLRSAITQLTTEDEETLKKLFQIDQISEVYLSKYLQTLWQLVDSKWKSALPSGKSTIFNLVQIYVLKDLEEDFCDTLLQYIMTTCLPLESPSDFIWKYLLYSPSQEIQMSRFAKVMSFLRPFIQSHWNHQQIAKGPIFPARYIINNIIVRLCVGIMNNTDFTVNPSHLVIEAKRSFLELIGLQHFLNESLRIDIVLEHLQKCIVQNSFHFPSAVAELFHSYILRHEKQLGITLIQILVNCTPYDCELKIAHALIKNYTHPYCHLTGITILNCVHFGEEHVSMYSDIIDVLLNSENRDVRAMADKFFKKMTSSVI